MKLLQFEPFTSFVSPGFWYLLTQKKLHEWRLDDSEKPLTLHFSVGRQNLPSRIDIGQNALQSQDVHDVGPHDTSSDEYKVGGYVKNTNTIEEFQKIDKSNLLSSLGHQIWEDITSDAISQHPNRLLRALLLVFADIKNYKFTYWFAYPALLPKEEPFQLQRVVPIADAFGEITIENFRAVRPTQAFFALNEYLEILPNFPDPSSISTHTCYFGFVDPSSLPDIPGWPLRNFLLFIKHKYQRKNPTLQRVNIIAYRETPGIKQPQSLLFEIHLGPMETFENPPKVVGYERFENKLSPRTIDLTSQMSISHLASSANQLNLQLMKWRLVPELDLHTISNQKCLLLGAGTLGCYVARGLLAWNVQTLTFVDWGNISFSNPARQALFEVEDCVNDGKEKAKCAAEKCKKIVPSVNANGVVLSIPMPGHAVHSEDETRKNILELEKLVESHDIVFLLLDSREARWLPTVIAASKAKLVINVALGFDSFLVMRHGMRRPTPECSGSIDTKSSSNDLGCYYCSDVIAPRNSLHDRTLDQTCTVTRPGLSLAASGLAVEMATSVLQSPSRACVEHLSHSDEGALGPVPHMVRGFLNSWDILKLSSSRWTHCVACSEGVLQGYENGGVDFLIRCLKDPDVMESVSGAKDTIKTVEVHDFASDIQTSEGDE